MKKKKVEVYWIENNRWRKKTFKDRKSAEKLLKSFDRGTYYIIGG